MTAFNRLDKGWTKEGQIAIDAMQILPIQRKTKPFRGQRVHRNHCNRVQHLDTEEHTKLDWTEPETKQTMLVLTY